MDPSSSPASLMRLLLTSQILDTSIGEADFCFDKKNSEERDSMRCVTETLDSLSIVWIG